MKSGADFGKRRAGRPLSFDRAEALHKAMLLFWRFGYEATSLQALTEGMGITPPSLYTAFGDKKQLFLEALTLYAYVDPVDAAGPTYAMEIIESSASAKDAAWNLMHSAAAALTGPNTPKGCMLASSATNCSPSSLDLQEHLARIRSANEESLRSKIEQEIEMGVLSSETDAEGLAAFFMEVIQGMSSQARDGASQSKLLKVAERAMCAWPG